VSLDYQLTHPLRSSMCLASVLRPLIKYDEPYKIKKDKFGNYTVWTSGNHRIKETPRGRKKVWQS